MNLTLTQLKFLADLAEKRPLKKPASAVARLFSDHYAIGIRAGNLVSYEESHWNSAQAMLKAHLGDEAASTASRATAALATGQRRIGRDLPGVSEKAGTRGPHADSVAVKALGGLAMDRGILPATLDGVHLPDWPGAYLTLCLSDAMRIQCDRILVVENLESFRQIDAYSWLEPGAGRLLVLYRGDTTHSPADCLALCSRRVEPVAWFGDFDPAGLGMALSFPRLEKVLLPDSDWLERVTVAAKRYDLFTNSIGQWGAVCDRSFSDEGERCQEAWAWCLMRSLKRGLPQEAMVGLVFESPR